MANEHPSTLGELRASGYRVLPVREEMRKNLIVKLRAGADVFPGIRGFGESVVPQIENAILSGQDGELELVGTGSIERTWLLTVRQVEGN